MSLRLLPDGNRMFTLAEGGEWLRRARVTPSPDAGLGLLSDLQRAHLLFVSDGSDADVATVEPGEFSCSHAGAYYVQLGDVEALGLSYPQSGFLLFCMSFDTCCHRCQEGLSLLDVHLRTLCTLLC